MKIFLNYSRISICVFALLSVILLLYFSFNLAFFAEDYESKIASKSRDVHAKIEEKSHAYHKEKPDKDVSVENCYLN